MCVCVRATVFCGAIFIGVCILTPRQPNIIEMILLILVSTRFHRILTKNVGKNPTNQLKLFEVEKSNGKCVGGARVAIAAHKSTIYSFHV